ncbi:MAG: 4-oxalocrotonate tautomerase [Gammaproteobacteria bacterium]|nr:4-oxalocrotonate tautomerase [Gammaproteobacteria bacterium]
MPLVQIHMLEGRSAEQKRALIEKVTEAVCASVAAPKEAVRVLITEVPKSHWGIGGVSAQELGR